MSDSSSPADPASPHDLPTLVQRHSPSSKFVVEENQQRTGSAEGSVLGSENLRVPLSRLGDYEILEEIGRGGMGVVFKARHVRLGRVVALKMLPGGLLARPEDLLRFETEAAAAAQLQHPGIVSLFEVGALEGQPYFSMEYVSGSSLAQRVALGVLPARLAAGYLERVARAVHYAHTRGIIHRDLKPGNILLDEQDQPKITDFGLAKVVQRDSGQTRTGTVLGTPSYMAPEQANASKNIDSACDVYSLGAILYELLTGRPPFVGETALATLQMVAHQDPVPPRLHNPTIDRDLETICLKCLEKDPARRYASAEALAEDLRRFLAGEPISARRLSALGRALKWCRRKPALAALVLVSLLSVITFVVLQYRAAQEERERREEAEWLEQLARFRAEGMRHLVYLARVRQAQNAWENADLKLAKQLLDKWNPVPELKDLRDWEWYYLQSLCQGRFTIAAHTGRATAVAFSPDGRGLASAGGDAGKPGEVKVWDSSTGQLLLRLPNRHTNAVTGLAFSPDGRWLATASADHTVRIWEGQSGQELAVLRDHRAPVNSVAFTATGEALLSGGGEGRAILWDLRTLSTGGTVRQHLVLTGHTGEITSVACSSRGDLLATAGLDETVRLWDARTGKLRHTLRGHEGEVMSLAFDSTGKILVSGGGPGLRRGQVKIWEVASGKPLRTHFGLSDRVLGVAVSHLGQVAAVGSDGLLHLWDEQRSSEAVRLRASIQLALGVAFAPDGLRLATAGSDGRIRLWNHTGTQETLRLSGHLRVEGLVFSADSKLLAAAVRAQGKDGEIRLWNLSTGQVVATHGGHIGQVRALALDSSNRWLASAGDDQVVLLHDLTGGLPPRVLRGHTGRVAALAFPPASGPAAGMVASAGEDDVIRFWDLQSGIQVRALTGHRNGVLTLAFSPDGKQLASGSYDKTVRVWDLESGRPHELKGHNGSVNAVVFSPDGKQLASASTDQAIIIWDLTSFSEHLRLEGTPRAIHALAWHPGGRRLASAGADRMVRLWDLVTKQEILQLEGGVGQLRGVAFSPDGRWLASGGDYSGIYLWLAEGR